MKKIEKIVTALTLLVMTGCTSTLPTASTTAEPLPPPGMAVSFQYFYDNLSPYGAWVSYPDYGYVWAPRVAGGFRPYFSSGHWVYTDLGWTWVSLYDWGWAPFHYGSWLYDPFYGWLWVPGYSWAPSWVTWGYYDGFYGWAPMGPGVAFSAGYYPPIDYWVFVPSQYVTVTGWNNRYYLPSQHRIVFDNNTAISNVRNINVVNNPGTFNGQTYSAGPRRTEFEKASNTRVSPVQIRESNAPVRTSLNGNTITMYRPKVDATNRASAKPENVTPLEKMKRSSAERIEADRSKSRVEERTFPERQREIKQNVPERQATPERQTAPQPQPRMEERKDISRPAPEPEQRKKDIGQPQPQMRQPEAQPKMNEPQMKQRGNSGMEREQAVPHQHRSLKQAQPEKMQRPEPQPRMAPERQPMERQPQVQPEPQQREHGRGPK